MADLIPSPDERLRPFATKRQWQVLTAFWEHGTKKGAAQALGIHHTTLAEAIRAVYEKARKAGVVPAQMADAPPYDLVHEVAPGMRSKGTSIRYDNAGNVQQFWNKTTIAGRDAADAVQIPNAKVASTADLYDPQGNVLMQWVRRVPDDKDRETAARAALDALCEKLPRARPVARTLRQRLLDDLLNLYVLTDFHLGMLAWPEESGAPWDMHIAEEMLMAWFAMAIDRAPPARVGLFANIGDFLHWDSMEAVTPTARHVLDADTRYQKLVRVAIRCVRRIIVQLLAKHDTVHVIMADANHDPVAGVWLRETLAQFYDEEPRLTVDTRPDPYYCYEHGATSLFFHHGHRKKPAKVDDVFVAKFREVFGRTRHSYGHMGHLHHEHKLETNLMVVEQHRTLAAKDAYAAKHGYMAGRAASVITYSKEFGDVGRVTITPEMVARAEPAVAA